MSETRALATREVFEVALSRRMASLAALVPDENRRRRAARVACNQVIRNPTLHEAAMGNPDGFADAVVAIVESGLEPGLGQAALVPYRSKNGWTIQPIIMFQGKVELALRSGEYSAIWADVIREGDDYRITRGETPSLHHIYGKDRGEILYAYACAKSVSGGVTWVCLDRREVERHKASSKTANREDGMWRNAEEAAWRKTAMHELYKWLRKSFEMQRAQAIDDEDLEPLPVVTIHPQTMPPREAVPAPAQATVQATVEDDFDFEVE